MNLNSQKSPHLILFLTIFRVKYYSRKKKHLLLGDIATFLIS